MAQGRAKQGRRLPIEMPPVRNWWPLPVNTRSSIRRCCAAEGPSTVTELTNYMKLSKKIIHGGDDLANLSPYNPVVREITTDFKPTCILAKIIISLAVTIIS
jgi:hypothetical protein